MERCATGTVFLSYCIWQASGQLFSKRDITSNDAPCLHVLWRGVLLPSSFSFTSSGQQLSKKDTTSKGTSQLGVVG
eukprot:7607902-Ditylum_brightwellii.AAC.1